MLAYFDKAGVRQYALLDTDDACSKASAVRNAARFLREMEA